jgi:hypothetical protein
MSTTAAFMPLVGADYYVPQITYPTRGATLKAGEKTRVVWYVMKMKLGEDGACRAYQWTGITTRRIREKTVEL